ncbi:MAG: hypothetical protein IH789_11220, partial [Acidobacteria bacterium]|nr:hypothetical protein [Acidobacteriota bacterium]
MGFLDGFGNDVALGNPDPLALPLEGILGPHARDHAQGFVPLVAGVRRIDAEALELERRRGAPRAELEAAVGPVTVGLGQHVATGEEVQWRVSIEGNPHLMVLGLPGMGKTTSLISICRQLAVAGINPIVFSYHHDIDERLAEVLGGVKSVDYQELGFNP